MVNKIMYQKIQHFKRKGFTKADIIRETGLNKRTVFKYYSMSEKKYSRYIEKVKYRTKIFEPYQSHILNLYQVNNFQSLEKSAVYDYLEEKLGSLPATERSFRNYISYLVETEQLKLNNHKRIYSPVAELPYGRQLQIDFGEYRTQRGLKLYILDPVKNYKTFAGVECRTAEEIGEAIERESSYYRSLLTQKKNADLFLFLEARGSYSEANTFRKYAQTFNPERAFNTIVLELQGKEKFKIDNLVFFKTEDLLLAEDDIKSKLVKLLTNSDSKFFIWLEQFPHLKGKIAKWRNSGRHNIITLAYALDEKSPFTALDEKVYNIDEFKTFFAKHITDKDLISEMTTPNSAFVVEADFWLKKYQGSAYLVVIISYFRENIEKMDKKVCTKLCEYIIGIGLDVDDYWDNIKPLVDKAYSNGFISENTIQRQKDFIIKEYESRTKPSDYGKKKKIIENLRIIEPSHKLIKRFEKEEKTFDFLKKSRLKEIEEERQNKIQEVKSDIYQRVEARKAAAWKKYAAENKGNLGCLVAVIGGVLGAIIAAGDRFGGFIGFLILGYIVGYIISFIIKQTGSSNAVKMITITPYEEKDMDNRIEGIEKDTQNKIANLDNKIGEEISKKTEEQIDEISRRIK